jgi:hypothetical protein
MDEKKGAIPIKGEKKVNNVRPYSRFLVNSVFFDPPTMTPIDAKPAAH